MHWSCIYERCENFLIRDPNEALEEETVCLCFWEWERTGELDWILSRDYLKRRA